MNSDVSIVLTDVGGLLFTPHAMERWQERFQDVDMASEIKTGVQFGAQKRNEKLLLLNCGAVLACDGRVVKTVLTKEHAIANMQTYGVSITLDGCDSPELHGATKEQKRFLRIDEAAKNLAYAGEKDAAKIRNTINTCGANGDARFTKYFYSRLNHHKRQRGL